MNRAQRRKAEKSKPAWQRMSHDQKLANLMKQGISPKDLERSYNDGYEQGRLVGINGTYAICFAAACLAANDLHGFGRRRCYRLMEAMQSHVINSLTSTEACDEVFRRMGLELDFGDYQSVRMVDG